MKRIIQEFKSINNHIMLVLSTVIVAMLCYGYQVTHPTVGMDDTAIKTYFVDGLAPQIGRWTLFVLNKIFYFADYTPFFIDLLGVMFMCLSTWIFCTLFHRISGGRIKTWAYVLFSVLFISSPFIEEVYIYYLHNGVGIAFLLTSISVMMIHDSVHRRRTCGLFMGSIGIALAIGCYESFALVYITVVCMVLFLEAEFGTQNSCGGVKDWIRSIGLYIFPLFAAIVLRKIVSKILTILIGIPLAERSASAMKYWFLNNPWVLLKDLIYQFILRYVISGKYFFGAFSFTCIAVVFALTVAVSACYRRKLMLALYGLAILVAPWLLIVVELTITPYRACQALMLFIAFGWMYLAQIVSSVSRMGVKKILCSMVAGASIIILFNQAFQLNAYFYYDTLKDRNDEFVCTAVANRLYEEFDTSKPIAFVGTYMMPQRLIDWSYVAASSDEYRWLGNQLNSFGRNSFYLYTNEYGYKIYDVASEDLLNWMLWASLNKQETEIYHYMYMLGYDFKTPDESQLRRAVQQAENMPAWPAKEAVADLGDCIVVHFDKKAGNN